MANQISIQTTETLSLLTSALNIDLNIGQSLLMNTSSVFMSLETTSIESLSNKLIEQIENAQMKNLPHVCKFFFLYILIYSRYFRLIL